MYHSEPLLESCLHYQRIHEIDDAENDCHEQIQVRLLQQGDQLEALLIGLCSTQNSVDGTTSRRSYGISVPHTWHFP